MAARKDHGFWPYLVPYFVAYLILVEIGARTGPEFAGAVLALKAVVPIGLLGYYFSRQGAYPELRGYGWRPSEVGLDFLVGVAGAVLWMAPYLIFPSLQPDPEEAFDPNQLGPELAWLVLILRGFAYSVSTPLIEELFLRSWLVRYIDVFDKRGDFRKVPIAKYTRNSFIVLVIVFTVSHVPWEWPVSLAWILLSQWYFYRRGHLMALVIVHAGSNLAIFLAAMLGGSSWPGPGGGLTSLWFFV